MRSEYKTHETIKRNLLNLGWKPCKGYKEHQLIGDYLLKDSLIRKIREINEAEFQARDLNEEQIKKAVETAIYKLQTTRDPVEILNFLKDGTIVNINRGQKGSVTVRVRFIDYKNPQNNEYCFIHEAKFKGKYDNIKPDFTLFINGIPVAVIEAKREFSETEEYTYEEGIKQIERYERESPELFKFVQVGVVFADREVYFPVWPNPEGEKRIKRKINPWRDDKGKENVLEMLNPSTLLDILLNFTFFSSKDEGTLKKILPRYMQYKAVNKAFGRIADYITNNSKKNKGLIWHWQGSGKTLEILFLTEKFFRTFESKNPVVFIIVDRRELERQFDLEDIGPLKNAKFKDVYKKIENVKELLQELKRIKQSEENTNINPKAVYLVMAHKFRKELTEVFDKQLGEVIKKKEILILRDEAHRTEGGKSVLSSVRNYILRNSLRFGFTGTPVHKQEKNTFQEYAYPQEGEFYLHKYFIRQSIEDGNTVPLTWRVAVSEGVNINLDKKQIEQLIYDYFVNRTLEDDDLDEIPEVSRSEVEKKLTFSDLLKADHFIDKAAHYIARKVAEDTENFNFKAMVVAQDRVSAVKFKRLLDKYAPEYIENYTPEWSQVVITHTNDDEEIIKQYRTEAESKYGKKIEELNKEWAENFKSPEKLPKILIVNKKLLTGFDAPILKVMYIAQLMKDVLLLQASARVNRVYPGKEYGLIVDLCGVLIENYKKAIEKYNIYEDDEIKKDILTNLFKDSSELWNEFLNKFKELKKLFKEVTGLEWDNFIDQIREGDKAVFNDVIDKIITTDKGMLLLYPLLKETVKLYETLGGYPEKVKLYETYRDLKILLAGINKKLKPKTAEIPEDVKEEILKRLEFKEIRDVADLELSPEKVEKLKNSGKTYQVVANFVIPLMSYLEDKTDPIHRAIYKRLEELKKKYLTQKVSVQQIIKQLKESVEELKNYDRVLKTLKPEEVVLKNLEFILKQQGINLEPTEELKEKIREFLNRRPTEEIKSQLKEELIFSVDDIEKLEKILDRIIDEVLIPMRGRFKNEQTGRG